MPFAVIDPANFLDNDMFREDEFLRLAEQFDWEKLRGKKVLVRGCSTVVPPWAYMYITARLMKVAESIRFGNEHDNIVIVRNIENRLSGHGPTGKDGMSEGEF